MTRRLPRFTVDDVVSWRPCQNSSMDYTRDGIQRLYGRRKYADAMMALLHPDVPDADKLWLVLRPEVIPEKVLQGLACDFAQRGLPTYEKEYPNDKRPREAIRIKRKWIRGKATDEELAAALDAARAAWAAARAAGAARAARAARAAELQWQVRRCIKVLEKWRNEP